MIRILIADDQQLFRDLLKYMLKDNTEIEVVATASNGLEAVAKAKEHLPDVILMDITMPVCSGAEAVKILREENYKMKILFLTGSIEMTSIGKAIRLGADGFIVKNVSQDELILAIKSIYAGMEVIHKDIIRIAGEIQNDQVVRKVLKSPKNTKIKVLINDFEIELSERDIKIIEMIVDGKETSEIANELFIAEGRVRNIITEMLSKMMLKDRTQLAVFSLKSGLVKGLL